MKKRGEAVSTLKKEMTIHMYGSDMYVAKSEPAGWINKDTKCFDNCLEINETMFFYE